MIEKSKGKETEEVVDFNFQEFFRFCINKWYWFLLCASCAVGIALFYIYRAQPQYNRYEQILIDDQSSSGGVGEVASTFSDLGLFSKNTNVYNELLALTSPAVMYQVADSLQLDMNYAVRDGLRAKTLYGNNLPFRVDMLDIDNQGSASFRIDKDRDGNMRLYRFRKMEGEKEVKYKEEIKVGPGTELVVTPIGRLKFSANPDYIAPAKEKDMVINIWKMPMQNTVELYSKKLVGDLADQDADVIELSIDDVSVQRATDILNYVLIVYNNNWISDKNRMALATSKFIDERLRVIQAELGEVDETIAEYKKKTGNPDIQAQLKASLELGGKLQENLIYTSNELSVAKYMQEFLVENDNLNTVMPMNLGIASADLTSQIAEYNELLMSRNSILNNSSESNPLVQNYNAQLRQLRSAIVHSVDNRVKNLQTSLQNLQGEKGRMTSSMANVPEEYLPLLSEERQQEIKQRLYLFLLQKREENELTQKFSADNIRMITPPVGPLSPVKPKKGLIIIVALIIGFGAPFIILYYLETSNTTVRSKRDLETLMPPFSGEIPQVGAKTNLKALANQRLLKKREEKAPMAVVEEGKRDVVNEAFRVIRGNLDFMSGKATGHQVIMLTSFNPGSGKSFIAYNLGMSYSIKGKKVLIIDCDLRHGSASMYVGSPNKGITSYLTGNTNDWESLVIKTQSSPNLSILPVGKIPPNPAELLEDDRMEKLIEEAKKDYDIVILDCPPVNIVVDSQILAPYADRTLFVVRAGLLQKSALKELNEFYEEKKFKNISVILNGTEATRSRYYTYGNYQNHS